MLTGVVRSGLVEARHPVSVAVVDGGGRSLLTLGSGLDTPFYARSAAKPFQTVVSQRNGADLVPEQLAVASGSHGGQPVHLAYIRDMLAGVGLSEDDLLCPPSWPMSTGAMLRIARSGVTEPVPIHHNCSGKHAGMLRACVARGWPLGYDAPDHPLQLENAAIFAEVTGGVVEPAGVDGCGVPTFRTTVSGLAAAYAKLAAVPEFTEVRTAMARFASLTSDGDRREAWLARWFPAAVKGGAQGCLGVAWYGGLGIAAKSWTGDPEPALVGIVEALHRLAILPPHPAEMLEPASRPVVTGGGRPVGALQPIEDAG